MTARGPTRLTDHAWIEDRLARPTLVARPIVRPDVLLALAEAVAGEPRLPIGTAREIATALGPVSLTIQSDETALPTAVEGRSAAAVLRHAAAAAPTHRRDCAELLLAHAAANDADGLRRSGSLLGIASATPWSEASVAGHDGAWPGREDDGADLPQTYDVAGGARSVTLRPFVLLGHPAALLPDAVATLRVLARGRSIPAKAVLSLVAA